MPTHTLTTEIIQAAISGFEAQKQHIDARIAELRQLMAGGNSATPAATQAAPAQPVAKRRKMSAAARKRIAEAQRKRWADAKKQSGATPKAAKPAAKKSKSRLSAEGRKRIIEATKKRWAVVRAAAAKSA